MSRSVVLKTHVAQLDCSVAVNLALICVVKAFRHDRV